MGLCMAIVVPGIVAAIRAGTAGGRATTSTVEVDDGTSVLSSEIRVGVGSDDGSVAAEAEGERRRVTMDRTRVVFRSTDAAIL